VLGVRGVFGVPSRSALPMMTLCRGVTGTFFESRCLGVLGSSFPSCIASADAFVGLKCALILGGQRATLFSGAPCFAGVVRVERVFVDFGVALLSRVTNGFSFSLLGSLSTTRLFARVDAAVDSVVSIWLRVRFPKRIVSAIAPAAFFFLGGDCLFVVVSLSVYS
jgi:hypothetical protein